MTDSPVPISFLVDDPTPVHHLYRYHVADIHGEKPFTGDGRELVKEVDDGFLDRFCDVVERRGIRGKFSIVPSPMGRGDVARGLDGVEPGRVSRWMDTAKRRLHPWMDFSPEMITHHWAVDLATGGLLKESEHDWSQRQDRRTLEPYIARALALLKDAGVDATGVTSPWMFGESVEAEYAAAIAGAQDRVNGRKLSWYFLHVDGKPGARPRVVHRADGRTVVHIPVVTDDLLWCTIHEHAASSPSLVAELAGQYLSADGREGVLRRALDAGSWPSFVCHWQTLYSNGAETGLAVLDEVARRVNEALKGKACWTRCSEAAAMVVEGPVSPGRMS